MEVPIPEQTVASMAVDAPAASPALPSENVAAPRDPDAVQSGDCVVLRERDDKYSFVKVGRKASAKIGKKFIKVGALVGAKYGSFFELRGTNLVPIDHDPHQEDDADPVVVTAPTEKTPDNRDLIDDNSAQSLTAADIAVLKSTAQSGADVVQKLAQNSATFQQKTEFAKAKYLRRKKKKYIVTIQVQKPTARTLCEAYFCKAPQKIRQLRVDSLAEIMLHSDAKSGSRIMTYDRCGGLVVGALLERLAGRGQVLSVFSGQAPAVGIVDQFNFSAEHKAILQHIPITALPNHPPKKTDAPQPPVVAPAAAAASDSTNEDNFEPPTKRRKTEETTDASAEVPLAAVRSGVAQQNVDSIVTQLRDVKNPNFDAIVLVPEDGDDPLHLLKLFWPFLAPSGSMVVFSPYLQPLAECYQDLMESHAIVHIRLFETWHRIHQVLPMRTHPTMQMHGASGYILSGYKVKAQYGLPLIPPKQKLAAAPVASSSTYFVADAPADDKAMDVDTKQ